MDITSGLPPNQSVFGHCSLTLYSITFHLIYSNIRPAPLFPEVVASVVTPLLVVESGRQMLLMTILRMNACGTIVVQLDSTAPAVLVPLPPFFGFSSASWLCALLVGRLSRIVVVSIVHGRHDHCS